MDILASLVKIGVYDMKIKSIEIKGVARIKNELNLEFNEGMNIICGINGTCKTTILECIAWCFSYEPFENIKKNALVSQGDVRFKLFAPQTDTFFYTINEFEPLNHDLKIEDYAEDDIDKELFYFKTNRLFQYKFLDVIPKDSTRSSIQSAKLNHTGIEFDDFKKWFIHRLLYSHIQGALSVEQLSNIETAQKCFNVLDKSITFSRLKADTNDIMINSQQGEIYLEYLSAGYKSCLYILLGIIKEIEYRFKNPTITVKDFSGVILIDEVDLHLHPIWQAKIVEALKETFPKAQIIVTTHSPHIIQSAKVNEIIPLVIDSNNDIVVNKIEVNEYGYQGWTIEEILLDVMGMETTNSELLATTMDNFNKAVDDNNRPGAKHNYDILNKMLHPSSPLRQILRIQMIGMDE